MENRRKIIGTRPNEVGEHQQFVDRSGQLVRVVRGQSEPVPVGRAYAFVRYDCSKSDIEDSLPYARRPTNIPEDLELYVMGGANGFTEDPEMLARIGRDSRLKDLANRAATAGMNYAIEAQHPGSSNAKTAGELGDVMTGIYNDLSYQSRVIPQDERPTGKVAYLRGDKYVFRGN